MKRKYDGASGSSKRARYAEPSGPMTDMDQMLGMYARNFMCTDYIKGRRMQIGPRLKDLFVNQKVAFQSLISASPSNLGVGYRTQGTYALNTRWITGNSVVWPRKLELPVYVMRTFCPVGTQRYGSQVVYKDFTPSVLYRLNAYQNSASEDWRYTWARQPVANNVDTDFPTVNAAFLQEATCNIQAQKVCLKSVDAKVLFSAPTATSCDVEVRLVRFTDSEAAPPDEGLRYDSLYANSTVFLNVRQNANDPALDVDIGNYGAYYDRWIHGKNTHPCSKFVGPSHLNGGAPFKTYRKFSKTLASLPRSAANLADTNPVQHLHRVLWKPNRWYDTGADTQEIFDTIGGPKLHGNNTGPTNAVSAKNYAMPQFESSLMQDPKTPCWIMISGWTRGSIIDTGVINLAQEPSFDVRMDCHFVAAPSPMFNTVYGSTGDAPPGGAGLVAQPVETLDPILENPVETTS